MKISVAGLSIELNERYDFIRSIAGDYESRSENIDFSVSVDDEDIKQEALLSEIKYSKSYLESIALYRKIAERLPKYDAVVFHGAVIAYNGGAYAFTARSGVGKTTHVRLWLEAFGDRVHILNGDKPVLRVIDGVTYACGTPFRGKEGYGISEMLPLRAVGFIERAEKPSVNKIGANEALIRFASQIYVPREPSSAALSLFVLNKIITQVPLFEVRANMDKSSAIAAFDAMTEKERA